LLVSVSFSGGRNDNTSLGDDALIQLRDFDFKGGLGGFEVGNDCSDSGVFLSKGSNGVLFVLVLDVELSLEFFSEVVE
jgi:hypothetical protein